MLEVQFLWLNLYGLNVYYKKVGLLFKANSNKVGSVRDNTYFMLWNRLRTKGFMFFNRKYHESRCCLCASSQFRMCPP